MTEIFDLTSGDVARQSGASVALVARYAKLGLIPVQRLSNGMAVFSRSAPATVRELKASRLANRGRRTA